MSNDIELKPCIWPDCGSHDELIGDDLRFHKNTTGMHWVMCNYCGADGPCERSKDEAITAWNTRHTPSEPINNSVVVPREPTGEMVEAGCRTYNDVMALYPQGFPAGAAYEIYKAMVNAAPSTTERSTVDEEQDSTVSEEPLRLKGWHEGRQPPDNGNTVVAALAFGDYITVEQKRYGAPNEMFQYKVIRTLDSNFYAKVPVDAAASGDRNELRGETVPVVQCICCGIDETRVVRFRVEDVQRMAKPDNSPSVMVDEARAIANSLWEMFYKITAPQWEPLPDLHGLLSQIDNMTAGLRDKLLVDREDLVHIYGDGTGSGYDFNFEIDQRIDTLLGGE